MTDQEQHKARALAEMVNGEGWAYFVAEIKERQVAGWDKFIAMSPEKKISKVAYKHQADYTCLRDALSWPEEQIRILEAKE